MLNVRSPSELAPFDQRRALEQRFATVDRARCDAVQCNEKYKLKVLDINGRDLSNYLKFDIISGKYSLSGCASGMYILNIEVGNQIFTEKILQQ